MRAVPTLKRWGMKLSWEIRKEKQKGSLRTWMQIGRKL